MRALEKNVIANRLLVGLILLSIILMVGALVYRSYERFLAARMTAEILAPLEPTDSWTRKPQLDAQKTWRQTAYPLEAA